MKPEKEPTCLKEQHAKEIKDITLVNRNCISLLESQVEALEGHNCSLIEKNQELKSEGESLEHSLQESKATMTELEVDFDRIVGESWALYLDAKQ